MHSGFCSICDGDLYVIGLLGSESGGLISGMVHYRCRDCGMDHHRTVDQEEPDFDLIDAMALDVAEAQAEVDADIAADQAEFEWIEENPWGVL